MSPNIDIVISNGVSGFQYARCARYWLTCVRKIGAGKLCSLSYYFHHAVLKIVLLSRVRLRNNCQFDLMLETLLEFFVTESLAPQLVNSFYTS